MMRKHWDKLALLLIIVAGIFFRTYHFSDWLHFGMDQARDAFLVSEAIESGVSHLPLLGPRAAGTFVRLGPVFYYFQFIAAKVFQSTDPAVLAYPDLLFSILTMPLLYVFSRIYFKKITALLITAAYAFNFVMIQYSRFAWNPNSIPFWTLLAFFSLFKAINEERHWKRVAWYGLMAFSVAVVSQLHFLVLAALPLIILAFLFWTGEIRKIRKTEIGIVLAILLMLYLPVILSDLATSGDNIKQFIWAMTHKPQEHSMWDNLKVGFQMHANYYTGILTTYLSKTGKASIIAGLFFGLFTFLVMVFNLKKERDAKRKQFLKLILLWSVVSFISLIPFAFQIKPRFLFFGIFIPFFLVGFGAEWLMADKRHRYLTSGTAIAVIVATIALNVEATLAWFESSRQKTDIQVLGNRQLIVAYPKNLVLSEYEHLARFVLDQWEENPTKLYFYGNMELRSPVVYLLDQQNKDLEYGFISYSSKDYTGRYYAITTVNGGYDSVPPHYQAKFDELTNSEFGKVLLTEVKLKEIQPDKSQKKTLQGKNDEEISETERNQKGDAPRRTERVDWADLLTSEEE